MGILQALVIDSSFSPPKKYNKQNNLLFLTSSRGIAPTGYRLIANEQVQV